MSQDFGVETVEASELSLFHDDPPYGPMPITLEYTGTAQELVRGTVLAKKDVAAGTPTYTGNTGNGTVGSITLGNGAKVGNYVLTCLSNAQVPAATGTATAAAGNSGDGTVTAAPATGVNAKVGTYTIECNDAETDAGTFIVRDPDGELVGVATVGVEFSTGGHLTFTIADGASDWVVGDLITVAVAGEDADAGTFSVKDPDGNSMPNATAGVAYTSDQINLTIADGTTDFVAGDVITIPVAAGNGKYGGYDPDSVLGLQRACAILAEDVDVAAAADENAVAYMAGYFNKDALTWTHSGITAGEKTTAYAQLQALGIFTK